MKRIIALTFTILTAIAANGFTSSPLIENCGQIKTGLLQSCQAPTFNAIALATTTAINQSNVALASATYAVGLASAADAHASTALAVATTTAAGLITEIADRIAGDLAISTSFLPLTGGTMSGTESFYGEHNISAGTPSASSVYVIGGLTPGAIDLGTAERFAVLSGAGITNVPTSSITGDLGVSPLTLASMTGWSYTNYGSSATSAQVDGHLYAANLSTPTPAMLTQAKSDLTVAYNVAMGSTPVPSGPFLNPGAGDLNGLSLVHGLYKFSTTALASGNFTLNGASTDVWIFQIGTALTVNNGVTMNLVGGADPKNIFWQVGTSASLGTNSIFYGTIMADQAITIGSTSALYGRALASIANVTLDSDLIVLPSSGSVSFPASYAFDNNPATYWESDGPYPQKLYFDFGSVKTLTRYSLTNAGTGGLLDPVTWTLEVSSNALSWHILDAQAGVSWVQPETKSFPITTPVPYRYVRLNVSVGSSSNVAIAEMKFYDQTTTITLTPTGDVTAVAFYGDGTHITGLTGVGDNLGNHIATTTVNANGHDIINIGTATASEYYGGGSHLTGIVAGVGDNLGNHIATTTINASGHDLINVGTATAVYYYGDGSHLTGIISGGGDVLKASTQTFTGLNSFTNMVSVSSSIAVGYVQVSSVCVEAVLTCVASCPGDTKVLGGGCSAFPMISPLQGYPSSPLDYTCENNVTNPMTAVAICARLE